MTRRTHAFTRAQPLTAASHAVEERAFRNNATVLGWCKATASANTSHAHTHPARVKGLSPLSLKAFESSDHLTF